VTAIAALVVGLLWLTQAYSQIGDIARTLLKISGFGCWFS